MKLIFKKEIEKLRFEKLKAKHIDKDDEWINKFWHGSHVLYQKGSSAPRVEKNICEYIKLLGFQAEKRAVTGRELRAPDIKTSLGTIVGKTTYIPSTGTKGSADISAVVHGMAVFIEVKFGNDKQSQYQKEYEKAVQAAGGFYFIAHDEDDFINKFNDLLEHPTMVLLASIKL